MGVVNATPLPLYSLEWRGIHCLGGWVCSSVGLGVGGKSRPALEFDPGTVQPAASRYTDCTIPAYEQGTVPVVTNSTYSNVQIWTGEQFRSRPRYFVISHLIRKGEAAGFPENWTTVYLARWSMSHRLLKHFSMFFMAVNKFAEDK
jgi:hypothetical protein